jgi:hypothetical protein
MTTVVTTFSKDGYDLYGHKMISSWIKFWPKDYILKIYTEDFFIDEKDPRIVEVNLNQVCPELIEFKRKSLELTDQSVSRVEKTIKWCHKVYAIKHAMHSPDDYLIFLDGDTYTIDIVPSTIAEKLVADKLFAVHFETIKHGLHFETGLIAFNLKHTQASWLRDTLTSVYDSLEIYNMEKTWDGFWFARLYTEHKLPVVNLSLNCSGVFCNPLIKKLLVHNVGTAKYRLAGYNKFTGRKQ